MGGSGVRGTGVCCKGSRESGSRLTIYQQGVHHAEHPTHPDQQGLRDPSDESPEVEGHGTVRGGVMSQPSDGDKHDLDQAEVEGHGFSDQGMVRPRGIVEAPESDERDAE